MFRLFSLVFGARKRSVLLTLLVVATAVGIAPTFAGASPRSATKAGVASRSASGHPDSSVQTTAARHADLRLQLTGLPDETRPDGNVTYRALVRNIGRGTAWEIVLGLETSPFPIAVSTDGFWCGTALDGVPCTMGSLRAGAVARVLLTIRAPARGQVFVKASVKSATAETTVRNNVASVRTPVFPADSVQVDATDISSASDFRLEISLHAISGRHGGDPDGTFSMHWAGEESTGTISCLNVSGNQAEVGITTPAAEATVGATASDYLLFLFTDNGSPGAGRDTFSLLGSATPLFCLLPFPGPASGPTVIPITTGEISIVDTP